MRKKKMVQNECADWDKLSAVTRVPNGLEKRDTVDDLRKTIVFAVLKSKSWRFPEKGTKQKYL